MANDQRGGKKDLVLAPNEFAYVQDQTNGNVTVCVGPLKSSLEEADQPVVFNYDSKRFKDTDITGAKTLFSTAPEGWYMILKNPTIDGKGPIGGRKESTLPVLKIGRKVNVPGPVSHALWPGQMAKTVKGHHLRSNQYLVVRVYDEESAKEFYKEAIITPQTEEVPTGEPLVGEYPDSGMPDLTMGKLMIIKGTEVSFYIPPTGIEVTEEKQGEGKDKKQVSLIREAVTLELLEYCILLDENGNKRYIQGPDVVFPKPTEKFMKGPKGSRKFKAVELNEISGLYVKVTADYEENGREYKTGEELFITGEDQMIYFPREEHTIIKYGDQEKHHAVAVPTGEARYVMKRMSGEIDLKPGPDMLLPDPRKEVIVRRALPDKQVKLWYPGNEEAEAYNANLRKLMEESPKVGPATRYISEDEVYTSTLIAPDSSLTFDSLDSPDRASKALREKAETFIGGSIDRKSEFSEPRTITLDTKYDGVPRIEPWTGYAVMVVNAKGVRKVVTGPTTILLDYDEYLESFEFSTGTPKSSDKTIKSAYLRVLNNRISDIVTTETRDLCEVDVHVSYRVSFTGEPKEWFSVENYVQHLCDHMRSFIRNVVKQHEVERFYENSISILRDSILGHKPETSVPEGSETPIIKDREGRLFKENGMLIYDVEVLDVRITDSEIAGLLINNQVGVVRQTLDLARRKREADLVIRTETITQSEQDARHESTMADFGRQEISDTKLFDVTAATERNAEALTVLQLDTKKGTESLNDEAASRRRERKKLDSDQELVVTGAINDLKMALMTGESDQFVKKAESISPQIIATLQSLGQGDLMARIAESLGPLAILGKKPLSEILSNILSGSSIDASLIKELHFDVEKLKELTVGKESDTTE
jgi:major vault protein